MKKILLLLSVLFSIELLSAQDFAIKNQKDQVLYYKVLSDNPNEVALVRGKEKYNDIEYVIPQNIEYNGKKYTVVEIADKAFYERPKVKSISLPNTIRKIGQQAFEDCNFDSFVFPDSLKIIGESAFFNTIIYKSGFSKTLNQFVGKYYTKPYLKGGYRLHQATQFEVIFKNDKTSVQKSISISKMNNIESELFMDDNTSYYLPVLNKVERPDNPEDRYSDIKEFIQDENNWFNFSDEFIDLEISGLVNKFDFKLKNKTNNTIKIIWDDAVFVNVDGNTSKIIHSGIKYSERENAQVPSTIIRNAKLTDVIVPTDFISYNESLKKWVNIDNLPTTNACEGKTITIMLPIQIKDVVNEYILEFILLYRPLHPERLSN